MQDRLARQRSTGLNTTGLRTWGMIFLALASAGSALIQNRMLNVAGSTDLLAVLNSEGGMLLATVALMLQAVECTAVPIFSFLLVEGAIHTRNYRNYLLRVAGLAVLTELPYNFAMTGKILDVSSRNPVFAMVLGLALLYFYRRYEQRKLSNILLKVLVTVAAILWSEMLVISHGSACVVLVAVLWALRNKQDYRTLAGCCASAVCVLMSPFYLAAPMGFMVIHFYNGEKGSSGKVRDYLTYPAALLVIGLIGMYL